MKKIIMLLLIISSLAFGKSVESINKDIDKLFTIVNQYQDIKLKGEYYAVDMKRLLQMTQMIESRGGRDNYLGRIAKTSYQIEEETLNHYIPLVQDLKCFLEKELDRQLIFGEEEDAIYYAYLLYMAKIRFHKNWIDKYYDKYYVDSDVEWLIYKILYNSIKGKSTYKKWKEREVELLCDSYVKQNN